MQTSKLGHSGMYAAMASGSRPFDVFLVDRFRVCVDVWCMYLDARMSACTCMDVCLHNCMSVCLSVWMYVSAYVRTLNPKP